MRNLTRFTLVRFLSVIKAEQTSQEALLKMLADAGFKPLNSGVQQNDIFLVYRDVLVNQEDMENNSPNDLTQEECQALQNLFNNNRISAEWLSSIVTQSELLNVPTKDVVYDGRTVCLEIYPQIAAYVE